MKLFQLSQAVVRGLRSIPAGRHLRSENLRVLRRNLRRDHQKISKLSSLRVQQMSLNPRLVAVNWLCPPTYINGRPCMAPLAG